MSRIAYVNGSYIPHNYAGISVEDRAHQFADGVYEVIALMAGKLVDAGLHLDRLDRSLSMLRIAPPLSRKAFPLIISEIVRRNRLIDGMVYMQVSRGVAPRYHAFPPASTPPGVVITARSHDYEASAMKASKGLKGITLPDNRWGRPDIKTVCLLPNILAKQQAIEAGAFEAFLVNKDGYVTEGTATNAWIVDQRGILRTHPVNGDILGGITRVRLLEIASIAGIPTEEIAFTPQELQDAREAFVSASISGITPIVEINNAPIGLGKVGPVTACLQQGYKEAAKKNRL